MTFKATRKSTFYIMNCVIPGTALGVAMFFSMAVPWSIGERISFATTMLLSVVVFFLMVSEQLPKTENTPFISYYFMILVCMGVVFCVAVVLQTKLQVTSKERETEREKLERNENLATRVAASLWKTKAMERAGRSFKQGLNKMFSGDLRQMQRGVRSAPDVVQGSAKLKGSPRDTEESEESYLSASPEVKLGIPTISTVRSHVPPPGGSSQVGDSKNPDPQMSFVSAADGNVSAPRI